MSTNGIWKSRYENEEGYGDTMWGWGPVVVSGDKVYVAGINIVHWFKQFDGQMVGFEMVGGLKRFKELETPDEKILPLIQAMNRAGVVTLGSCEGHLTERIGGYFQKKPHVYYLAKTSRPALENNVPEGWEIWTPFGDLDVLCLNPKKDAENQSELDRMQEQVLELAGRISQANR